MTKKKFPSTSASANNIYFHHAIDNDDDVGDADDNADDDDDDNDDADDDEDEDEGIVDAGGDKISFLPLLLL